MAECQCLKYQCDAIKAKKRNLEIKNTQLNKKMTEFYNSLITTLIDEI
jgi:hypothetical protein